VKGVRYALVTGAIGSGKTTVAGRVVERARACGLTVAGLWCPGRTLHGDKVGIDAVDLSRGMRRLLALQHGRTAEERISLATPGVATGRYRFDPQVMAWANDVLARAVKARPDLLVVDEIGPLELEQGEGFAPVIGRLAAGEVPCALLVVRERLLEGLRGCLPAASTSSFPVEEHTRDSAPGRILDWLHPGPRWE